MEKEHLLEKQDGGNVDDQPLIVSRNDKNDVKKQQVALSIRMSNTMVAAGPYVKHWWRCKWQRLAHFCNNMWRYGRDQPSEIQIDSVVLIHVREQCDTHSQSITSTTTTTTTTSNKQDKQEVEKDIIIDYILKSLQKAVFCDDCDARHRSHLDIKDITKAFIQAWLKAPKSGEASDGVAQFDQPMEQWIFDQKLCTDWHCGWHFVRINYKTSIHHNDEQQKTLLYGGNRRAHLVFPPRSLTSSLSSTAPFGNDTKATPGKKSLRKKNNITTLTEQEQRYFWVIPDFERQDITGFVQSLLKNVVSPASSVEEETLKKADDLTPEERLWFYTWFQCSMVLNHSTGHLYRNDKLLF